MGKYDPLHQYLLASGSNKVNMTFSELQQVLGCTLPRSAFTHPAWWGNNGQGHTHGQAWLDAGYKVDGVDRRAKTVSFCKIGSDY